MVVLAIGYFKGKPTEYVIKYARGRVVAEGHGLAFYYLRHNTNIVAVPTSTIDVSFIFNEITSDFQEITLQGQYTYLITDPNKVASQLNFAVDPRTGSPLSDEPERLPQRITNLIQVDARADIQSRSLEEALVQAPNIAASIATRITESGVLAQFGVELLALNFVSARPNPEVAKALEADYREGLLRRADEAIYARRAAAVEQERAIKENELNTDIALEQQRERLVQLEGANLQQEAEARGKAQELEAQFRARARQLEAEARTKAMQMEVAAYDSTEPGKILALAMRELGANAERIAAALLAPQAAETPSPSAAESDSADQSRDREKARGRK